MNGIDFTTGLGETIAWPWPIAVYLFFAGISGGSLCIALMLRFFKGQTENTPLLKAASLLGFVTIALGMVCLVFDLTNPLFFWKMLVFYNFQSVMSIGVIALSVFIPLTALVAAWAMREELQLLTKRIPQLQMLNDLMDKLAAFRRPAEWTTLILAIAVCAYTGFLISALIRFPLINTSVLPALFVASGLSAGAAAAKLIAVKFFNEPLHSSEMEILHKAEWPILAAEALFIFMLFSNLLFSGTAGAAALNAFSGGGWSNVFWIGVVGLGFVMPVFLAFGLGKKFAHSKQALYLTSACVISGMMCLRMFLLYAGQLNAI